jgi:hypothetical protein
MPTAAQGNSLISPYRRSPTPRFHWRCVLFVLRFASTKHRCADCVWVVQVLDLSWHRRITDISVGSFVGNLTSLHTLILTGCPGVTLSGVEDLTEDRRAVYPYVEAVVHPLDADGAWILGGNTVPLFEKRVFMLLWGQIRTRSRVCDWQPTCTRSQSVRTS